MQKTLLIFMGWCSTTSLYRSFIYSDYNVIFIDIDNYKNIVISENTEINIISWSMGTIMAMEFIMKYRVNKAVFISPTLNFTLTTPKVIIKKMIKNLKYDKIKTIIDFIKFNFYNDNIGETYISKYFNDIKILSDNTLEKGLIYLRDSDISDIVLSQVINPLIIISEDDKIISIDNSEKFISKFDNPQVIRLKYTGHNIIFEGNITHYINRYIKGE
ncbi:MAG: alpha/beta hydrolase [Fusobacteria bacterium]|nr:alpha/beta hydrolase [Fusobacteriota bacterium]